MDLLAQGIVTGVLIGGLYALMSLGVSLSWGALKIINLAHFSFILLSAYLVYQLTITFGLDPLLMMLVVVPVFFVLGVLIQMFFHWAKVDEFKSLIVTFGIFIILQSLMQTFWSADFRRIGSELNPYEGNSLFIGDIALQIPSLLAFIAALGIAVAMSFVLSRTYFGRAVRAVAQDAEMARAYGVDPNRVAVLLSGLSGAFSAMAGVFIALGQAIYPGLAVSWFGVVFSVVILGGLGNTVGALTAGVIVGVAAGAAAVIWGPLAAPLVTFIILIAALLFRPQGLLTSRSVA
ncbi:MAG TPA: branched-chain amino acid ABC transporter permease [Acidimicrobiia bacterium]|nr:branched-chain amino acid ABC transporter permease [Acidimicrobiia bacterium]